MSLDMIWPLGTLNSVHFELLDTKTKEKNL